MTILPFLVFGVVAGSVYGLAAMGLVLTYKTSGIFNFAQGGIAAAAAFTYYALHVQHGVPSWIALVMAVPVFGVVTGLALEITARRLAEVETAYKITGTIGILLMATFGSIALFGGQSRPFPSFLPTDGVTVFGTIVRTDQIITSVVALVCAVGLCLFFRLTRLGTAMRAVVDDPQLLDMTGTPPARVRRAAWIIGSTFAALSGVLIAPILGLDATLLTLLVVQAFGAAAVGAFTSLPLSYAGGLLVGLVANLLPKFTSDYPALEGLPLAVPFVVLFIGLLVTPQRKLIEAGRLVRRRSPPTGSVRLRGGLATVGLVMLLVSPFLVGAKLPVYTNALTYVILFMSLSLLVRTSGQVSLCHIGFQAIGAATFTHLGSVPWVVAIVVAGLAAVPLGVLVAIPASRLSNLFLALATFGLGILLQYLIYNNAVLFGAAGGRTAPRPHLSWLAVESDRGYFYVLLVAVGLTVVAVSAVERARIGRLLRALSDSPVALNTLGLNVRTLRVLVFAISSFLAGLSGALVGPLQGVIDQVRFNYFNSLTLLAVLSIAVMVLRGGSIGSAFLAAAMIAVVPAYITRPGILDLLPVLFGAGALGAALLSQSATGFPALDRRRSREDLHRTPAASRGLELAATT